MILGILNRSCSVGIKPMTRDKEKKRTVVFYRTKKEKGDQVKKKKRKSECPAPVNGSLSLSVSVVRQ